VIAMHDGSWTACLLVVDMPAKGRKDRTTAVALISRLD
jgi:hypothetical protein